MPALPHAWRTAGTRPHRSCKIQSMVDIEKVGLLLLSGGRLLLCRKRRDTSRLILPGGRIEPGESHEACLLREVAEELGPQTRVQDVKYIGVYEDVASFDDPAIRKTLRIHLYQGRLEGKPAASSEIAELIWFGPGDDPAQLTPILRNRILPDLLARGILPAPTRGAVELLAPARDLACGIAAINCGADAVYIGAPRFGAREAAGNGLEDITALVRHAHAYWARVYVTLNTLLRDEELDAAVRLAWRLYEAGIDGLIIQDTGLLESELPPLPLIASTQMHNVSPEKVAFLEKVGFHRAILARELDLDQIHAIRQAAPHIELETFVHGALCVCYSGQCALSYALGGRSGNRGQCAQPCRKHYTLVDAGGRAIAAGHLLSLRDLNLTAGLGDLLDAGVTSFKIEGRLKDALYVANVTAWYRRQLDPLLAQRGIPRASSGVTALDFEPDLNKTFNRGYTEYYLHGRKEPPGEPRTPKMLGERLGPITAIAKGAATVDTEQTIHPGDGIAFFDSSGQLTGATVNAVDGNRITPERLEGMRKGAILFRNHDHQFLTRLRKAHPQRQIRVAFSMTAADGVITLAALDEDGIRAEAASTTPWAAAQKPDTARAFIDRQLRKTGGTPFRCTQVDISIEQQVPAISAAIVNDLRRTLLENLAQAREAARPTLDAAIQQNDAPFPTAQLTFLGNVLNRRARKFYQRHGVTEIEPAAESGLDMTARTLMTCRYCIRHQLRMCPKDSPGGPPLPWRLVDDEGRPLELTFDCAACQMHVRLP